NPCTADVCGPAGTTYVPVADGTPCPAKDACIVGSTCQAGVCSGGAALACGVGQNCVAGTCLGPACSGTIGLPGVPEVAVSVDPRAVAAADFDGDGRVDLAIADYGGGTVSVLTNLGAGKLAPPLELAAVTNPGEIVAADLDSDGRPDLLV